MSINNPPTDPTLDPVTGIPLDASYATQYQVPLGSQPINLEELNAQGKQGNWLYPDNLPPVVARLQARDLTNPGNAQDLSTDGQRNLNVNINALNPNVPIGGGGSVPTFVPIQVELSGRIGLDPQFISLPDVLMYKYFIGYHASYLPVDGGGSQNVSPFLIQLNFNTFNPARIDLMWAYAQYSVSDGTFHSFPVNTTSYFPYKMNISAIVAAGATSCELDANGGSDGSIWTASMIFSNL